MADIPCGVTVSNTRGNIIFPFIEDQELAVLNTGDPTHFHIQTETFSVIDLSLSSPDCFLDFSWIALDDRMDTDHFPIVINIIDEVAVPRSSRWILDRANWALFSTLAFLEIKAEDFETVDDALDFLSEVIINAAILSEVIINAATESIPRSSGKFKRGQFPGGTLCRVARKAMRAAFTRYRRNPCNSYLISYKKLRARFRYQVKQAKRLSWVNYISTLTWKTTLSEVWTKIRKITGKYIPSSPPVIKENGSLITDPRMLVKLSQSTLQLYLPNNLIHHITSSVFMRRTKL